MRLGLVARADNTGLGVQTHEFYKHMLPSKTMVVNISDLNGNSQHLERYPDAHVVNGFPNRGDINAFLEDLDVVFVAESPYNYYLYERAKELGVKVAVQYNYEFFDWFAYPHYPTPDMLIAPSLWHYEKVQDFATQRGIKHVYLHCPVNRDVLPFRKIEQFKTFIHVVGKSAAFDRNGTETVIDAAKLLKSDAKVVIHFQGEQGLGHQATSTIDDYLARIGTAENITARMSDFKDYWEVYKTGDVLLLPRRYGGNCLPANEALSVGMPVIMTDISPNNLWLPNDWLLPAQKIGEFKPRMIVDIYGVNPAILATKIDEFATMTPEMAMSHNLIADGLANKINWDVMRTKYWITLSDLCDQ